MDTVCADIRIALSVKIRLGLDNADTFREVIPLLNDYPLAAVIIHPRTARQLYAGSVDPQRFREACGLSRHPVIYNGDITARHHLTGLQRHIPGISGFMIGRGAVAHPCLIEELTEKRSTPPGDAARRIQAFHDSLYEEYAKRLSGPAHILGAMKELWGYLHASFTNGRHALKKIRRITSRQKYESFISRWFSETAAYGAAVQSSLDTALDRMIQER